MLKNLMRLLLSKFYSKKESEAVGHQAMPSVSVITLSPTTSSVTGWAPVYEGIAPTDGYAAIRFTADSDNCIAAAQTTNVNTFSTPQVKGDVLMAACPVAKGQPFGLYAREAHNIACWYTKTIGGGYLSKIFSMFCTGGKLCLNNLSLCLLRNLLRFALNGSAAKDIHQATRRPYLCKKTLGANTWHQQMDTSLLKKTTPKTLQTCLFTRLICTFLALGKTGSDCLFPSARDKKFLTTLTLEREPQAVRQHLHLRSLSELHNYLAKGGALC